MEEVEILCDRVIILDKGKIIASGTTDELKEMAKNKEKIRVEAKNIEEKNIQDIKKLSCVEDVLYKDNMLEVSYTDENNNLENIISYLKLNNIKYSRIFSERPTLNDVFLELTGKELRD